MRKLWTIAKREYGAMVGTKTFLISVLLMPLLMFGGIIGASRLENIGPKSDRRIVIADGTGGTLFDDLKQAADARNETLAASVAPAPAADESAKNGDRLHMKSQDLAKQAGRFPSEAKYVLERYDKDVLADEDRLELSNRIRSDEIAAFVELPGDLLSTGPSAEKVRFYAQNAMLSGERGWIEFAVNEAVKTHRLAALKLDPAVVRQATAPVAVQPLGLFKQTARGIRGADEKQNMVGLFLPMGFMMLMFMVIFMSAQPLLESVMEEKTGRIAEVLLGSVSPMQLMGGKLLGNVAGSLSVLAIYGLGAYAVAAYKGWTDFIPMDLVRWFLLYQLLAVLLFSSLFIAVGAAVVNAKDAQTLLIPIWVVISCPMMVWLPIVREPTGSLAEWMSFSPPVAPLTMVLRLAGEAVIPMWQILLSLAVLAAATIVWEYAAGRICRIGLVCQGRRPKFTELIRWAFT
jgi:ABC-type Na+ efflux pump permease subunit